MSRVYTSSNIFYHKELTVTCLRIIWTKFGLKTPQQPTSSHYLVYSPLYQWNVIYNNKLHARYNINLHVKRQCSLTILTIIYNTVNEPPCRGVLIINIKLTYIQ